ncbi:MAG: hypothetical protein R3E31_04805 [Chloroflexota bacterium]
MKRQLKALYRLWTRRQQQPDKRPLLINSIPKSGTHLLKNIVLAIPGTYFRADLAETAVLPTPHAQLAYLQAGLYDLRPGVVYIGHIPYSPLVADWLRQQGVRQIFIYRDPRDYTISLTHYIMRERRNLYDTFATQPDDEARLLLAICGSGGGQRAYSYATPDALPNVHFMYAAFLGWRSEADVLAVRYEDLIGADGAAAATAVSTLRRILTHLHMPISDTLLDAMRHEGMQPAHSPTYRQGRSHAWQSEYRAAHHAAFTAIAPTLLNELGYQP